MRRTLLVLLPAALAAGLLLPAAAPARSTVHVVSVPAPAAASPGAQIELIARTSSATRERVVFWLSRRGRLGSGDVRLAALAPLGRVASTSATIPAGTRVGRYRLLACSGRGCARSRVLTITTAPATSEDLIEAALAAHRLSQGTALLYRVYAAYHDPRLPARYQGELAPADDAVFRDLADAWPGLSHGLRGQLAPFVLPPAYRAPLHRSAAADAGGPAAGAADYRTEVCLHNPVWEDSWRVGYTQQDGGTRQPRRFRTFVSPDGHVRFWYDAAVPYTGQTAHALAPQIGRIWATYKAIMGRQPLSDAGADCFWGGDGRYDVYIEPSDEKGSVWGAQTVAYPPKCSPSPAFTVAEGKIDAWELAHEMFHAFQDAFPTKQRCGLYNWIAEGSADWAAHVAFPDIHREHGEGAFLYDTFFAPPELNDIKGGAYETWPLWMFFAQSAGNQVIGSIWSHAGDADAVHAVDEAVPGGWRKQWPQLVRAAYNQEPWAPFVQWDAWPEQPPVLKQAIGLSGAQKKQRDVQISEHGRIDDLDYPGLYWLKRAYTELDIGDDVQSIDLTNPRPGDADWSYQAYLHFTDGHWQYRDLSSQKDLNLCRQNPDEDVDRIVLMMGNSHIEDDNSDFSRPAPKLTARADCNHYYKVTALSASMSYQAHYPLNRYHGDTCYVTGSEKYTMSSRDSGNPTDGSTNDQFGYLAAPNRTDGGTVDYGDPCNYPSSGDDPCHSDLPPDDGSISVQINHQEGAPDATVQVLAYGRDLDGDIYCHDRFADGWLSDDDQWLSAQVPWSELTGNQAFTVTASDQPSDLYRSVSRQFSMTLKPVDIDGSTLPGS